jgi:hypothetical protein
MCCRNVDSILIEMMNSCSVLCFKLCLAYSLVFSNVEFISLKIIYSEKT